MARATSFAGKGPAAFDLIRLEALLHLLNSPRGGEMTIVHLLDSRSRIELSRIPAIHALAQANSQRQQGQPLLMVSG
jgi:hypothetical protein